MGEANGSYKLGAFTDEAIAERKAVSRLIREVRRQLEEVDA